MTVGQKRERASRGEAGFALPMVLLLLAVMSVVAGRLIEQSRDQAVLADAYVREAVVRRAADGGIELALHRAVRDGTLPPGAEIEAEIGAARVAVAIESEVGKVDLNVGPLALLEGLLVDAGVAEVRAGRIVAGVAEERRATPRRIFRSVDELLRVPEVDLALLERLRPALTVFGAAPGINPAVASGQVLRAVPGVTDALAERILAARAGSAPYPQEARELLAPYQTPGRQVFRLVARATMGERARFERVAVVDLAIAEEPIMLDWGQAAPGMEAR